VHGRGRVNHVVAQIAGAGGAVGLAVLILAPRRELRIAGLFAWRSAVVRSWSTSRHTGTTVCSRRGGPLGGRGVRRSMDRAAIPWLLAIATLACTPARIPVHVGSTQANLLLPLYGVVAIRGDRAPRGSCTGEEHRARELGRSPGRSGLLSAGRRVLLWTKDVRQGGIELLFFVLPFGLLSVRAVAAEVVAILGVDALRPDSADGARLRVIGVVQ